MRTFLAFLQKEWMELFRTGRMLLLLLVFVLFGIMNPAIAKLTPWLMETMADSLEGAGLSVETVAVDAMTSWTQFYKNIPMALIVFVLLWSSSFSAEHQRGTWIAVVTKGFARWKIVAAKSMMIVFSWTACYWLCFGITYAYNAYFWDNRIVGHPFFAAGCYWLFGLWTMGFMIFFSAVSTYSILPLLGTGGALGITYLAEFVPKAKHSTPIRLTDAASLLTGLAEPDGYLTPILLAIGITVLCAGMAVIGFRKKDI